jgi:Mannose-1-phosphate guanylyltransferase
LWNGGMFIWKTKYIIELIKKYLPSTYEGLKEIEYIEDNKLTSYINQNYCKTDAISIDYGIMEKVNDIYVIPSELGWDDIGNWRAYERYNSKDEYKNIKRGEATFVDAKQNIVINNGKKVILYAVEDIFLVEKDDYILITSKEKLVSLKENKSRLL